MKSLQFSLHRKINAPATDSWQGRMHTIFQSLRELLSILPLLFIRAFSLVLQLLMQFFIAHIAGAQGVGTLQTYQTWSCLLGEVNALGLPTKLIKALSLRHNMSQHRNFFIVSIYMIVIAWFVLLTALAILSIAIPTFIFSNLTLILCIMGSTLSFAILRISADTLKAKNQLFSAVLFENALLPLCLILLCTLYLVMTWIQPNRVFITFANSQVALFASIFLMAIALASVVSALQTFQSDKTLAVPTFKHCKTVISRDTAYFWGSALLSIGFINLPFLILPYFANMTDIGIFAVAFKFLSPIATLLIMLSAYFAPKFSRAASNNNGKALKRLLFTSQAVSLMLYVPFVLCLLLFYQPLLKLFGKEFVSASPYLLVLAIAQLVNAATGLPGVLLNMIGAEKFEFISAISFTTLSVFGCLYAGAQFSIWGIVITYCIIFACKNLSSFIIALYCICKINQKHQQLNGARENNKAVSEIVL